jgi:hypothetical protein
MNDRWFKKEFPLPPDQQLLLLLLLQLLLVQ